MRPIAGESRDPPIPLSDIVKTALGKLDWEAKHYWQKRYLGQSQWAWLPLERRLQVLDLPEHVFYREWLLRHADALRALRKLRLWNFPKELIDGLDGLADPGASGSFKATWREENQRDRTRKAEALVEQVQSRGVTPALLQKLGRDWGLRFDLLRSATCPHVLLEHFGKHRNVEWREWVAANQASPSYLLRQLAADKNSDVRKVVGRNPACPPDIVGLLAQDSDKWVRQSIAANSRTPDHALQSLVTDVCPEVRCALVRNSACPANILARLANDSDSDVLIGVASNPASPTSVLSSLVNNTSFDVTSSLARNPSSPPDVLRHLFDEEAKFCRFGPPRGNWHQGDLLDNLMANPACPSDVIERMAEAYPSLQRSIARLDRCPTFLLESLAQSDDYEIRFAVARNPSTPEALRQSLFQQLVADAGMSRLQELVRLQYGSDLVQEQARARLWWLSMKALAREYSSETVLDRLTTGEDVLALMSLLRTEATCMLESPQASLAAQVIGAGDGHVLTLPPGIADSACSSGASVLRWLGLSQPHASPEQLAKRVASTEWTERLAIASNPACPSGLLTRLMTDAHTAVAAQARATHAARPNRIAQLEAEIIQTQENEPDLGVLAIEIAARLLHCEQAGSVLGTRWEKYLAIDQRLGLRGNEKFWPVIALLPPATGAAIWRLQVDKKYPKLGWAKVVKSKLSEQRAFAAGVPGCPIELVRRFANDGSYPVRVAVIRNPSCPPEIVDFLSDESHEFVQEAVEERRMAAAILRELLERDDYPEESIWVTHPLVVSVALDRLTLPLPDPNSPSCSAAERLLIVVHPAFPADKREGLINEVASITSAWLDETPWSADTERWSPDDFVLPLGVLGLLPDDGDGKVISKAARSRDWLMRAAVTFSPSVTPHVLRLLFDDAHEVVKWLAARRLATIKSPKVPSANR
jgi:hypothetical protein